MRSLAHVELVKHVDGISGASEIEKARVLGWDVVTRKGEVKPGDLIVFFEIDSFIPVKPMYEFLRASSYKQLEDRDGFRIKTRRLLKQISQGLILPVSMFPEIQDPKPGMDVTDLLGVRLYELPVPANLRGHIIGKFPAWIRKTDQERIQNHPEYFDLDIVYEVTEKIDGTSATYWKENGEIHCCSRNLHLKNDGGRTVYWEIASKLPDMIEGHAYQGEIAGEGINKNPLRLVGRHFFLFDIWDIAKQRYLLRKERMPLAGDFVHVPFVGEMKLMDDVLDAARGPSALCSKKAREGIVFKSTELVDGNVLSFKVLNNDLL